MIFTVFENLKKVERDECKCRYSPSKQKHKGLYDQSQLLNSRRLRTTIEKYITSVQVTLKSVCTKM